MHSKIIQKYSKKTTAQLKRIAIEKFNRFIRERDKDKPCISCGKWKIEHASHYFAAGKYNHLRFDEDNVAGSCLACNYFEHGNLLKYRDGLINRIGIERVEALEQKAKMVQMSKDNRFNLIHVIEKYK
jgi:hypothetical protein